MFLNIYIENIRNRSIIYLERFRNNMIFGNTFKALSDPIRRDILEMLRKNRMSAGDIASRYDMSQATISYHLSILKKADLVKETKEKNYIYYSLNTSVFEEIMQWVMHFTEGMDDKR